MEQVEEGQDAAFDAGAPIPAVDLSNCDAEPIHVPGSIQPHGVLLAFDPEEMRLAYVSENFAALVGEAPQALFGRSVEELVNGDSIEVLREAALGRSNGFTAPVSVRILGEPAGTRRMGLVGCFDDMILLEAELESSIQPDAATRTTRSLEPSVRKLRRSTSAIQAATSMDDLYRTIAEEIRSLNGFDRAMVYRFLPDGHGAVVGESAREGLEPFLGLHYPATDIPQQARRLYRLNTLRLIADVNAKPAQILAAERYRDRPLNLTHSAFRSVSPIHIEYLQNMGVSASMSISILQGGELWGLIACHHYVPRYVPLETRAACELLGVAAGTYLTARQLAAEAEEKSERRSRLAEAWERAASRESYADGLRHAADALIHAADADGVAICSRQSSSFGLTPPPDAVEAIRSRFLATDHATLAIESLAEFVEGADAYAEQASGALLVRGGMHDSDCLLFFRREYAQVVRWAGNPEKSVEATESGVRLSPRKSFALWQQTARLRSREWTATDAQIADEMVSGLATLAARRAGELDRMNDELARMNSDLNSFAFSVSHDLKEPLRSIHQTLFFLEQGLADNDRAGIERRLDSLRRITGQMNELIDALLRFSRVGRTDLRREPVDLAEVVREANELIFGEGRDDIRLTVGKLPVWSVDFMVLREAFANLLQNAAKYNDREVKEIEVGAVSLAELADRPPDASGDAAVFVRDNGIGIAEEHWERVFSIFQRLHGKSSYGGGAGAGLTVARKILERHGGTLWVRCAPGQGSTFYMTMGASEDAS